MEIPMPQTANQAVTFDKTSKIVFVVPRYGQDIVGGAERLVRGMAEELHQRGYTVEVLTTCTRSMAEWSNHYEPGSLVVNGVPVRRFAIDQYDIGQVNRTVAKALAGEKVPYNEQIAFIRQNLNSQALYQYLSDHKDEIACAIFVPYLFGITYWGIKAIAEKAVLLPCLHDEPLAYFTIYRELLEQVRGIIFNAEGERQLTFEKLGVVNRSSVVVGLGFEPPSDDIDVEAFRSTYKLPHELLLYSGRIEAGKNVPLLLEYFERYHAERKGPWTLALTGGDGVLPAYDNVVPLGFLDDKMLRSAYAAAKLLIQPSLNESFSIVMMEAWQYGTPVLVHGDCAVTAGHVASSNGGWTFRSYEEFRDALDQITSDAQEREKRGQAGKQYVAEQYNWDAVIERLLAGLAEFTRPLGLYEQLSRRGVRRALEFSRDRFEERFGQVIARAEADLEQGISRTQINTLREAAHVAMRDYQVSSSTPVVGKFVAWLRRNLTSHIREPYIDPIIDKQEKYNKLILEILLPALERSQHHQQRLERQIRLLERRIEQLQAQIEQQNKDY
jgi:glycosyltransferase involved in cell wall biosynthesis